ncbi:CYTH domain-containing protein [Ensifer sp. P24N7]|uniref:CYTH domain-containing protein n=1 Tax=Sinorhizobium sp. P24N7 TaxID=3348358 RepID=UPI0035F3DC10
MAIEIERKFQVLDDGWRSIASTGTALRQAYLIATKPRTLRLRLIDAQRATLTAKFRRGHITREEYEYAIPYSDALRMFEFALGTVEKVRYQIQYADHLWQVDVYFGANCGLIVAEIELRNWWDDPPHPKWLGPEITGNPLYSNRALAMRRRASAMTCPLSQASPPACPLSEPGRNEIRVRGTQKLRLLDNGDAV